MKVCKECSGDGYVIISCCGDDIKDSFCNLCPTCLEHCDTEQEECEWYFSGVETGNQGKGSWEKEQSDKQDFVIRDSDLHWSFIEEMKSPTGKFAL